MKLKILGTISDEARWVIADNEDEDAPMVKVEFCNEFAALPQRAKISALTAMALLLDGSVEDTSRDFWLVAEMRNALGDAEEMLSALVSMLCADATGDTEHGLAMLNTNELARRVDNCRDVLSRLPYAEQRP